MNNNTTPPNDAFNNPNTLKAPGNDRYAAALAEIQGMRDELHSLREQNKTLQQDLHRAEDRQTLLIDERNRCRAEGNIYRNKLVELATSMSNIHILMEPAVELMHTAQALIDRVDGGDETPQEPHRTPMPRQVDMSKLNDAILESKAQPHGK